MVEKFSADRAPSPDVLKPRNLLLLGRQAARESGLIIAGNEPDQLDVMRQLEYQVAIELERHNRMRKPWVPIDFMPIDQQTGQILHRFTDPSEVPMLSPEAKSAMTVNLATEENIPSYHRVIANNFGLDGPWGTWDNLWTAEEANHAYSMRMFLDLTRAIDPYETEQIRMEQVKQGYNVEKDPLHTLAYVTFQETATRVSHRETGIAANNDIANKLLKRIAADENYHMLFYRNVAGAALDIAPNQMMQAICDEVTSFEMPGANIKDFQIMSLQIANAGIYDLRRHLKEVVMPVLKIWRIFEREDFSGYGEVARDELAVFLEKLDVKASKFEESRDSGKIGRAILTMQKRAGLQ